MMFTPGKEKPLRLLSLDGGGIRGLSELIMIRELMHRLKVKENATLESNGQLPLISLPKPCDYFDLIGGTSTGGIIALMLGRLRMDVDIAIEQYNRLVEEVFSQPKRWGNEKFKATKLEEVIKSIIAKMTGDSEAPLLEDGAAGGCRTFVCASNRLNMNATIPVLFRTYQSHETHTHCKIWEAARATSAVPKFFKEIELGRKQPFIDGGFGNNNPSKLVLEEASKIFGSRQVGCMVSIGTGQVGIITVRAPRYFQPTNIFEVMHAIATDCEKTHEGILSSNSPNTVYFRLNVDQGMQGIQFSEWEKLADVEAHTTQYMRTNKVGEMLSLTVNAIEQLRICETCGQYYYL